VTAPPGNIIGYVTQEWSICVPKFRIENAIGESVLRIEGPFCTMSCCGDVQFQVLSKDGSTQVGKITKQWSGLVREAFTDADNFGISFPLDLDVNMKAVMLGACFLIVRQIHFNFHQIFIFFSIFFRILCSSKKRLIKRTIGRECFKRFCHNFGKLIFESIQ
jgi:hypothetical protein